MRRAVAVALAVVLAVALGACGSSADRGSGGTGAPAVAAFFPIAATLRGLGGPGFRVRDLTPPGVEPHDLELTTADMDGILDAPLVVVMGKGFQPTIERAASHRDHGTVFVLDHLRAGSDPHVWLDPMTMRRVVALLAAAMEHGYPDRRGEIRLRQRRLDAQLQALDREYRAGLDPCGRSVIVTAHAAFGRLAARYGLRQHAIAGMSPEQEPDPRRLADLADLVKRDGVTTVFTERLVSPRVAEALAREANVRTAVLDPIESPRAATTFVGYVAAMRRNLSVLRAALACP